jgi:heme-degrading monooxygenase HmoA
MIHQLRIYEIFEHNKAAFHERFREHALRIWQPYGFKLVAAWESRNEGRTEFLYLLEWPDEESMRSAWEKFRADEEWIDVKRVMAAQYGELVGKIEEKALTPTSYSPTLIRY